MGLVIDGSAPVTVERAGMGWGTLLVRERVFEAESIQASVAAQRR